MKKLSVRLLSAVMAVCCVFSVAVLSGCGKDKDPETYGVADGASQSAAVSDNGVLKPDGTGLKIDHIKAAGFNMYKDTLADIKAHEGEPADVSTEEYQAEIYVEAKYGFGSFSLSDYSGTSADKAVLIIANIGGDHVMPCGIHRGDDLYAVADSIYAGSSEKIKASDGSDKVWLYGDSGSDTYGSFEYLDTEFIAEGSEQVSVLEYRVPSDIEGYVRYTIYFDCNNKVCDSMIYWGQFK